MMQNTFWLLPSFATPTSDNWIAYKGSDGVVRLKVIS